MSGTSSRCPECHGTSFNYEGTCTGCGLMYVAEDYAQQDANVDYARHCDHMEVLYEPCRQHAPAPTRKARLNVSELIDQLPIRCKQDFYTGRIGSIEMYIMHHNLVRDDFARNGVQHFYVNNVGKSANEFQCYASYLPTTGCYDGMKITVPVC